MKRRQEKGPMGFGGGGGQTKPSEHPLIETHISPAADHPKEFIWLSGGEAQPHKGQRLMHVFVRLLAQSVFGFCDLAQMCIRERN